MMGYINTVTYWKKHDGIVIWMKSNSKYYLIMFYPYQASDCASATIVDNPWILHYGPVRLPGNGCLEEFQLD